MPTPRPRKHCPQKHYPWKPRPRKPSREVLRNAPPNHPRNCARPPAVRRWTAARLARGLAVGSTLDSAADSARSLVRGLVRDLVRGLVRDLVRDLVRVLPLASIACLAASTGGCRTPESYRHEADAVAQGILQDKQHVALGRVDQGLAQIASPADTLRRRLLTSQNLPIVGPQALGISALDEIQHWPQDDYLTALAGASDGLDPQIIGQMAKPNLFGYVTVLGGEAPEEDQEVLALSLKGALMVAAASSRVYQSQKETVYRTALALDLERHAFRTTFSGAYSGLLSGEADSGDGTPGAELSQTLDAGVTRQFQNGTLLTSNLALNLAQILGSAGSAANAVSFDASIAIPLMRGSGAHIVAEPLRQAERDVVYALWSFERFKRTFAISIASSYINVLQQQDRVRNATLNYLSLIRTTRRAQALNSTGRLNAIDYGQAIQNEIGARSGWINEINSYKNDLDDFKITLGLPPDARLILQPAELQTLGEQVQALIALDDVVNNGDPDDPLGPIQLQLPSRQGGGPMELPTRDAMLLAFHHRLDLQRAIGEVYDAQRGVVVAADGFLAELSLLGGVSLGGNANPTGDDVSLDLDTASYSALLALDLPFDRVAERNNYRDALIDLESSVRDLQDLEDDIKIDVINLLRDLELAREQVRVQTEAVKVAEARREQTALSLELGRNIRIRDVNEAEEDYINALNDLTTALVAYRIAEWSLQRDTGTLQVDAQGLWAPLDPHKLNQLIQEARQAPGRTPAPAPAPAPGSAPGSAASAPGRPAAESLTPGPQNPGSQTPGPQPPASKTPDPHGSDPGASGPQTSGPGASGPGASGPGASGPGASDPKASDPRAPKISASHQP